MLKNWIDKVQLKNGQSTHTYSNNDCSDNFENDKVLKMSNDPMLSIKQQVCIKF